MKVGIGIVLSSWIETHIYKLSLRITLPAFHVICKGRLVARSLYGHLLRGIMALL
jgi:hypothetical protein